MKKSMLVVVSALALCPMMLNAQVTSQVMSGSNPMPQKLVMSGSNPMPQKLALYSLIRAFFGM